MNTLTLPIQVNHGQNAFNAFVQNLQNQFLIDNFNPPPTSQKKGQFGGKLSDIFTLFNLIMAIAIVLVIQGGNMIRRENYWGFAVVTCGLLIGFANKEFNKN